MVNALVTLDSYFSSESTVESTEIEQLEGKSWRETALLTVQSVVDSKKSMRCLQER